jgi:MFS family permease
MRRGPLAQSYWGAVALVVLALVPFLLLTAAVLPLGEVIAKSVGLSPRSFDLTVALSDAAYAFGTVLAIQFAVHLPPRRMLLIYVSVFVLASLLSAWAPTPGVFVGAFIVQGLCTSLMLIAAVPPLVTGWPPAKMPITGMTMNLCIFGAVAVGPTIGSLQAASGGWRPLFWGVAIVGVLALLFAVLTFEDDEPSDTDAPWDIVAILLAGGGCAAGFFGAGELEATKSADTLSLVPLVAGVAMIVTLVVYQYRRRNPLMPVKKLATTFPVTGLVIALFASSAAFGLMELLLALQPKSTLTHTALLFLPEFGAAVVTAGIFGLLFRTRFTPVFALGGMVVLAAAAAVATGTATNGNGALAAVSAGLVGVGVGASVSPALFLAGFSLRSAEIQRIFALIELLRGVTAFLVAPILLYLVSVLGPTSAVGIRNGMWICFALATGGGLLAAAVFLLGGQQLQAPDLKRWQEHDEPAWDSAKLLARLKAGSSRASDRSDAPATVERG